MVNEVVSRPMLHKVTGACHRMLEGGGVEGPGDVGSGEGVHSSVVPGAEEGRGGKFGSEFSFLTA